MDGIEAVEKLRETEAATATSAKSSLNADDLEVGMPMCKPQLIIGISANSDQVTRNKALQAGMQAFMAKPFTMEHFHDVVLRKLPDKAVNFSPRNSH